ncbi:MAG: polysaccharide biosynthesis protein [Phycisphaerales bacterium]|jgi:nucleoside-diphosphate-sugar epimerase|nr:polysaccharide biosynthesis protein [Phycisphaerales bacterium]
MPPRDPDSPHGLAAPATPGEARGAGEPAQVVLVGSADEVVRARTLLETQASGTTACRVVAEVRLPDRPDCLACIERIAAIAQMVRVDRVIVCGPEALGASHRAALESLTLPRGSLPAFAPLIRAALEGTRPTEPSRPTAGRDAQKSRPASRDAAPWKPGPTPARSAIALGPGLPRIDPVELIGRRAHPIDRARVEPMLRGKRVLITGAGGSIGSELARIACDFQPEAIALMERGENALFEIDRTLAARFPGVRREAMLHDVVDEPGTLALVSRFRPHVVLHSAAHKHVPLMEDHPAHAVTNNLFGTRSIADASVASGVERFVMISSDKAVNPTSVMGATKRLAELYVQGLHARLHAHAGGHATSALGMVRFGNVLGSASSVLQIWAGQLDAGEPIGVTDPRMTRYFMTIPEAAALVMQAAALAGTDPREGQARAAAVYVLDMGEPVRIMDLAQRFIRAWGMQPRLLIPGSAPTAELDPETPIADIVVTGARPGEKLHEELAYAAEHLTPAGAPGVNAWVGAGSRAGEGLDVDAMIRELDDARSRGTREDVLAAIRRWVPEMRRGVPADPKESISRLSAARIPGSGGDADRRSTDRPHAA